MGSRSQDKTRHFPRQDQDKTSIKIKMLFQVSVLQDKLLLLKTRQAQDKTFDNVY